jgi:TRAP-type mannitol/chloroaromatic compound transport system permease small subunit
MKDFFKKVWAAIKAPMCYAAIVLILGLCFFSAIDAIVRCFHQQVFNGIVQFGWMLAVIPIAAVGIATLVNEAKR